MSKGHLRASGDPTIYFDGRYLRVAPQLLAAFVPGAFRLHGVFETMRCERGRVELLDEHLCRLMGGLKALKVSHPYSIAGLKRVLSRVVKKNRGIALGRLRLMVFQTGGSVHCMASLSDYRPPALRRLKFVHTDRPAAGRYAGVKSLDYALFARAYQKARAAGCDEALLINRAGDVFEASRANVFVFSGGTLLTPPLSSGCLNGIGRQQVLRLSRRLGVPVREQRLTPQMVRRAGKVFLSNSLLGLAAAGRIKV